MSSLAAQRQLKRFSRREKYFIFDRCFWHPTSVKLKAFGNRDGCGEKSVSLDSLMSHAQFVDKIFRQIIDTIVDL